MCLNDKEVFVKHEKAPTSPDRRGNEYLVYADVLHEKSQLFSILAKFDHFPVAKSGQNCKKAHLHVKTFHMSLFLGLYDHRLKRNSLENLMFRT